MAKTSPSSRRDPQHAPVNRVGDQPTGSTVAAAAPDPHADTKACPFCAETIRFNAVKCRYCSSDLSVARRRTAMGSVLGVASVVMATAGGVAEVLSLTGVNRGSSAPPRPRSFAPGDAGSVATAEGMHAALLVAALLLGAAGVVAAVTIRRRPRVAVSVLAGAAVGGAVITLVVGVNVFVVVLAIAFAIAAVVAAVRANAYAPTQVWPRRHDATP